MQENHNEQPIELTYPVKIQLTNPNATNNSDQSMDSDREQATEPCIRREDITIMLVEQHSSSDKTMDDLLKLKKILELAIRSLKHSLPVLHLPKEQMNELIKALMMAAEQFKNVQDSACPFTQYLKKED